MPILLIRHGKALQDSPSGRDFDRALASRGKTQATWLGKELLADGQLTPSRVIASSWVRAYQTAALIAQEVMVDVETHSSLGCDSSAGAIVELAQQFAAESPNDTVALVGHQPIMGGAVAVLSGGPVSPWVEVATGQCFVLDPPAEGRPDEGLWSIRAQLRTHG